MQKEFQPHLLIDFLQLSVPIEINRIKSGEVPLRFGPRPDITKLIGERGDVLLYGGQGCKEAFVAVTEAIARLAFAPGGVTAFGLHFEETIEES
jgi:hypothetical protein